MEMRILGIDPGKDGGFFLVEVDESWTSVSGKMAVMPTRTRDAGFLKTKKGRLKRDKHGNKIVRRKTEVDPEAMVALLRDMDPDYIFLEDVSARPGQGVTSMFSFGRSFGDVRTAGAWLGCPLELARPQDWQKVAFADEDKGEKDPKVLSTRVATKLWPDMDLRKSSRCQNVHDGICDAACIAEYGRRRLSEG
jgi:crossover junction endodeoxyribonuclease RuvC